MRRCGLLSAEMLNNVLLCVTSLICNIAAIIKTMASIRAVAQLSDTDYDIAQSNFRTE